MGPTTTRPRSEIITVGDEILRGDVINGNAAYLGRALSALGLVPHWSTVVADDKNEIHVALQRALSRANVIVMTGGLGPTPDDLTRDALAEFFDIPLVEDAELLTHVQALFRSRGAEMPDTSRNQALFPDGAMQIPNPHGTATGIHVERDGRHVFALPGVAVEMRQMTDDYVVPILRTAFPDALSLTRTLRLAGIGESLLLKRMQECPDPSPSVSIAFLPHHGLLDVRLTARSFDRFESEAQVAEAESILRHCAGEHVYATGDVTLAAVLGNILTNRAQTLATAESCTGGLIANMLTDTPGSSRWFERGWVTYSNDAKIENLHVPAELIETHGAVSEPVARAMAEGARIQARAHWGLATTGIAGPDGGTDEKPVGTVWMAVASETKTQALHLQFSGLRETIKLRTAHMALYSFYRELVTLAH